MSIRMLLPYAAGLALTVTLAGCAAESAAPQPAGTAPGAPAVSRSVTISEATGPTPAPPTSTAPNFPAGVPVAARKHTKAGAVAFVRHYVDQLNVAWTTPDPEAIRDLCDVRVSKACAANLKDAEAYKRDGLRYSGTPAHTKSIAPLGVEPDQTHRILWTGVQLRNDLVDSKEKVIQSYPREELRLAFFLRWTDSGWLILDERLAS
ncbi:hypothetical protein OO014_10275 [Intrasporangium calvum]|uniref:Lipoprotein n=1 Tax=Intrasporangium calvum TaxID=53358 RepID=A0ABT5GIH0_9MICO|nr:DUF6318 family protein [Intrasporangium calvum]MDC5697645.1 hypothetical protein [Intrasporangium calvum]